LEEELGLVEVERERVGEELVCLLVACPEFCRGLGEVDDGLAFDSAFVAAVAPVAEVECLVDEDQDAGCLLPERRRRTADVQGALADVGREDAVLPADVGVAPAA